VRKPVYAGYLADPFLLRTPEGIVAYGTGRPDDSAATLCTAAVSDDAQTWRPVGTILIGPGAEVGTDYWAPEVAFEEGEYWMYYSVGHGIAGHHVRVAHATSPLGPFVDTGVNLTPNDSFAIDAHPFRDEDGSWYLFFARDVLDAERPGTHLAAVRLTSMTSVGAEVTPILAPNADWQIYERDREMYGRRFAWHTLEGPSVILRDGTYYLFFSGGSWEGSGYGVSYATAQHPLGPWTAAAGDNPLVLSTALTGLTGPGHSSILRGDDGRDLIAYHAWDSGMSKRQMYIDEVSWTDGIPTVIEGFAAGVLGD
jgi:arabinan endo-1,5-alpha-L-arabinosidase